MVDKKIKNGQSASRQPTKDEFEYIALLQRKAQLAIKQAELAAAEANVAMTELAIACSAPVGTQLTMRGDSVEWALPPQEQRAP